jgi:hypothetical protein
MDAEVTVPDVFQLGLNSMQATLGDVIRPETEEAKAAAREHLVNLFNNKHSNRFVEFTQEATGTLPKGNRKLSMA